MPYGQPGSIPGAPYGGLTGDYIDGLTKQTFILDYLGNGLFPCNSSIVKGIRSKKKDWKFNDRFEYRMLLANSNTGGSLNGSLYNPTGGLVRPGELEYGVFRASYGTVTDSLYLDMTANLETREKMASFNTEWAARMQSMRFNVANIYKCFAIHGSYGPVMQLSATKNNLTTLSDGVTHDLVTSGWTPVVGAGIAASFAPADLEAASFILDVPPNVHASNFKKGRTLLKTGTPRAGAPAGSVEGYKPWDTGEAGLVILVLGNQPSGANSGVAGQLKLVILPGTPTAVMDGVNNVPWRAGQWLEITDNRYLANGLSAPLFTLGGGGLNPSIFGQLYSAPGTAAGIGGGNSPVGLTGGMEGLADLFPWYSVPTTGERLGLDLPFRDQPNRLNYTVEQAGGWVYQQSGMTIMDAVLAGIMSTAQAVSLDGLGVWMNPMTRQAIEYEEGETMGIRATRQLAASSPIMFQRGITSTTYHIGSKTIPEVLDDFNLPTDVIIIGPRQDISYNCWDNTTMDIDKYIKDSWEGMGKPERLEEVELPDDFVTSLDVSKRIVYGTPMLTDGVNTGRFVHPRNTLPVHYFEMGNLFTECPYAYTVVKLRHSYFSPNDIKLDY